MVEMQNGADINLEKVGFTYPEDTNTDSLQQLKQHDLRLSQTKDTLVSQQIRLKRVIRNFRKMKRGESRPIFSGSEEFLSNMLNFLVNFDN